MHYYKFEIATWHLHTSHLSLIEEAVYFRLINFYYDTETPIPKETQSVIRRLRLTEYADVVLSVLSEFFELHNDGWHQKHCDQKIIEYHGKAKTNKSNGLKGGRPKNQTETQSVISGNPDETLIKNNKQGIKNNKQLINKKYTPEGVDMNIWDDFLILRKAKKLPITETAIKGLIREGQKAGLSLNQTVQLCCERNWAGFKAEWVIDKQKSGGYESAKDKSRREFNEQIWGSLKNDSVIDIN